MTELWRRRAVAPAHDGWIALAARILRGSADLSGAACAGHGRLYDPDVRAEDLGLTDEAERWSSIQATCVRCPARSRCWAWASDSSARLRPVGPTAATEVNILAIGRAQRRRHGYLDDVS